MVFSVLSGGLGNQMFQYAFGYSLAGRRDEKLVLETSELSKDHKRNYALSPFCISNKVISIPPGHFKTLRRIWNGIPANIEDYTEHTEFSYDAAVFEKKGHLRVHGYWQCPLYFQNMRGELLHKFALQKPGHAFLKMKAQVGNDISVGIHVRRGDYISEQLTNDVHGTCSVNYYRNAIALINQKYPQSTIRFYIFSDDISWCRQEFSFLENISFAEELSDAEELILMSHCKHNIIANSSFSWWAAWLNQNEDKTVVAPEQWFKNKTSDTSQLIPETWIRL